MPTVKNPEAPYWKALEATERAVISEALTATGGRLKDAAQALGINRNHMVSRMKHLGIHRADFMKPPASQPARVPAADVAPEDWMK